MGKLTEQRENREKIQEKFLLTGISLSWGS